MRIHIPLNTLTSGLSSCGDTHATYVIVSSLRGDLDAVAFLRKLWFGL